MSWKETEVPAVQGGSRLLARIRFSDGEPCVVEASIGPDPPIRGEGSDLFDALAAVRRQLDTRSVLLQCNGSRRDVYPSQMQRQATSGRRAYVLNLPRSPARPPTVDIFDTAPPDSVLASVDEQRAWFDQWVQGAPNQGQLA